MKHDIRLVRGQPDDTELAALIAVLVTVTEQKPAEHTTPPVRVHWSGDSGEYRAPNSWR